jgi:outer membrane protein TolC
MQQFLPRINIPRCLQVTWWVNVVLLAAGLSFDSLPATAQCVGVVSELSTAATCTSQRQAPAGIVTIDPSRPYHLEEMIDIAETNNPHARIAWEEAKQAAEHVGIARSTYFPKLAGMALFGDERIIVPFPKPLAPVGYVMVEIPTVESGFELEYTIFDFGKRRSQLESSRALQFAATARLQRANQDVAYRLVVAYYNLVTAQEKLTAIRQILSTAQTTQSVAEAQLANGRATLPDVLNARAATAQAAYDLETSIGDEAMARVRLREALGVEPSDEITVAKPISAPEASAVSNSVTTLVEAAMHDRPDLQSFAEKLRAANEDIKTARSSYRPQIEFQSNAAQQSIWPSMSQPNLGNTTQFVWNVGLKLRWELFDGGARRNEVLLAQSKQRQSVDELREKRDEVTRETWTAYLQFRTAARQREAAQSLLTAATTSYDASLDAYRYGVKNLVDLVTAESQLAQARLSDVQARSAVLTSAVTLGYTTGNLLRLRPVATQPTVAQPSPH